jgi:hypothetical protein
MGCRCNERRAAIARAVQAAKTGDGEITDLVKKELAFVATTTAQDAASTFRASVAAAKARLSFRRR